MEPKARIKSGLIAVALGLTTTFSPVGSPFSLWESTATAQTTGQGYYAAPVRQTPTGYGNMSVTQPVAETSAPMAAMHQVQAEQAYAESARKLLQARKAVAHKDFATAERLASEVRSMNLVYRDTDERPEAILMLLQQARGIVEQQRAAGNTDPFRRNYAQFLLHQADGLLRKGEIDLAAQLTREAAAQNIVYSQADLESGLAPQAMYRRIEDAKRIHGMNHAAHPAAPASAQPMSQATLRDLHQALSLLQQARQAMSVGQLDRAEKIAQAAINLRLPESAFPRGADTPNRVLAEIAARRQPQLAAAVAAQPNVPMSGPTGAAPAVYHPGQDRTQNIQVRNNDQVIRFADPRQQPAAAQQVVPMAHHSVPVVDQAMRDRQAVLQQVASEIMQQISDAQRMSREQRNPDAGLDILKQARQRVEESQLDPQTKASFLRNIDMATEDTVRFIQRYEAQFAQDEINAQIRKERQMEIEHLRSKEEKLKTLIMECNKLIDDQRFEEAVILSRKAREFAPDEPATHMLVTSTQLAANVHRNMQIQEERRMGVVDSLLAVDAAAAIPYGIDDRTVIYPKDWKTFISRRRSTDQIREARRPETERDILRKLEMPVSLNVNGAMPLGTLLQLLQAQTGVEMFVDKAALREIDVTTDYPIEIRLMKEIKLRSVLNIILEQVGLAYVVKNEMLNITSAIKAKGQLYYETYYVGDLIMGIPNFNGETSSDFNRSIERSMRHSVQPTAGQMHPNLAGNMPGGADPNLMAMAGVNPHVHAQLFGSGGSSTGMGSNAGGLASSGYGSPVNAGAGGGTADFGDIIALIEAVVSPESWDEGGEMMEYYPTLSLVVRQTEEVHAEIVELLNQLRKLNDLQIAVEVRFITLSDDFYEKMGLDFQMSFRNDNGANRITSVTTSSTSGSSSDDDDEDEQLRITGDKLTVGLEGSGKAFSADLSIPFTQNTFDLVNPAYGGFSADSGLRMGFALLSDIEAYFFMSATQGDSRTNVLQAPKVMIFNGQTGAITDISQQPFVTSVIPVVGDFAAAYQPIVVVLNEGQFMTVQGTVSSNRQYVRLTLNPVFNKITKVETFRYFGEDSVTDETETSSKGDDQGTTASDERASKRKQNQSRSGVTIQLPTLASFSVQTTVSVPDGGTILLGGIKRLSEGRTEAGTPILNKIPYLNRLFMNTAIGRSTQNILMMVTPRIIIQEEEEEYLTGIPASNP